MPRDGDSRYNTDRDVWEQYREPPGAWEEIDSDFGQLDRPPAEEGLDQAGPDAGL